MVSFDAESQDEASPLRMNQIEGNQVTTIQTRLNFVSISSIKLVVSSSNHGATTGFFRNLKKNLKKMLDK